MGSRAKKIFPDITHIPQVPGIYIMKNTAGTILYIGKSLSLRSRVNTYFHGYTDLDIAKKRMVDQIQTVEYIETKTETEALILETNYIKHHTPKYNILMKDGKNLSYIMITDEVVPQVIRVRSKKDLGVYFWPFSLQANITKNIENLRKMFRIRSCKMLFEQKKEGNIRIAHTAGKSIPCMDFYIGICPAPCLLTSESLSTHDQHIKHLRSFLEGKDEWVIEHISLQMQQAAAFQNFELAALLRDQIWQLKNIQMRHMFRAPISWDKDVVELLQTYETRYIGYMQIRDGKVVNIVLQEVQSGIEETDMSIIAHFLVDQYTQHPPISARELLLSTQITECVLLDFLKQYTIILHIPVQGAKKEILDFLRHQCMNFAHMRELQKIWKREISKKTQFSILDKLGYLKAWKKVCVFECFDVSHLHGRSTVASRVVMINGKLFPQKYRRYKIQSLQDGQIDDFASLEEVMYRRTQEALLHDNLPDLYIIDGGKGQLSAAQKWIERGGMPLCDVAICSLAKKQEEVFLPGRSDPLVFSVGSSELNVFVLIRNEAHRFAVSFHRNTRTKQMKKNILEELPGFGPKTRKKLLKKVGSIDAIQLFSPSDLTDVLTKTQIQTLQDHGFISIV